MSVYKIPRKIKRFEIFQPKTTLKNWYNKQSDKPDILFNASLYTSSNKPCGTIIDDGKLINNAGSGFGFGTTDKKTVLFGSPWDKKWQDYITGYYGLVQNGKAMPPTWNDPYVFGQSLSRIAFGQLKDGSYAVFCENSVQIRTFAANAVKQGFMSLCNLDGGGSRALLWLGNWIYTSTRTPYNAVAIWLEDDEASEEDDKIVTSRPSNGIKVKCHRKTLVYDKNGRLEAGRSISVGDICIITPKVTSNLLIPIIYPTSNGNRSSYVKNIVDFIAM